MFPELAFVEDSAINLLKDIHLEPSTCGLLTYQGFRLFQQHDEEHAFGDDIYMRSLGLTICAIAHEFSPSVSVQLFVRYLAPYVFNAAGDNMAGVQEALFTKLMDSCTVIVNEGASRGLTDRFAKAILASKIPSGTYRLRDLGY